METGRRPRRYQDVYRCATVKVKEQQSGMFRGGVVGARPPSGPSPPTRQAVRRGGQPYASTTPQQWPPIHSCKTDRQINSLMRTGQRKSQSCRTSLSNKEVKWAALVLQNGEERRFLFKFNGFKMSGCRGMAQNIHVTYIFTKLLTHPF